MGHCGHSERSEESLFNQYINQQRFFVISFLRMTCYIELYTIEKSPAIVYNIFLEIYIN